MTLSTKWTRALLGLATLGALVFALYLWSTGPTVADQRTGEIPGTTYEYAPGRPDLVVGINLPEPDQSGAVEAEVGLNTIRSIDGVNEVLDVVSRRDASALLGLFQLHGMQCNARSAPDCADANNAQAGQFDAIQIEDGGTHFHLAVNRAEALLAAILGAGRPDPVVATRDTRTVSGDQGTYFLAFHVGPFDASDPAFGYAPDTVGNGFGLKVNTNADRPIVQLTLLTEEWNPLKWLQMVDHEGAMYHELIFPENLDGFDGVYDGLPTGGQ